MKLERLRIKSKGIRDVFDQWADGDGQRRIGRALSAAEASAPVESGAYKRSLRVERVEHPSRPVLRVVADVDYAMQVEAEHGTLSRSLDAALGD